MKIYFANRREPHIDSDYFGCNLKLYDLFQFSNIPIAREGTSRPASMRLQNRDKVFTMIPPMAAAGDHKLKDKAAPILPWFKVSLTSAAAIHRETP